MLIKCFSAGLMTVALVVSAPRDNHEQTEICMYQQIKDLPFGPHLIGDDNGLVDWYFANCCGDNPYTLRNKRRDLIHLLSFLSDRLGKRPHEIMIAEVTRQILQEFVTYRLRQGDTPGTVNNRIALVKHLWNEPCRHFPTMYNPTQWLRSLKADRVLWGPIPADKVQEAIVAAYRAGFSHYVRYRAGFLVELMIATGLRAHDISNILLSQVGPELDWIRQIPCKGRKFRNVYVPEEIRPQFAAYLHYREEALVETKAGYRQLSPRERGEFPLFVSVHRARLSDPSSFRLTRTNMTNIFEVIEDSCGFRITARMCRHRFAHTLYEQTKDVRLVSRALGHSDIRTTMRYLEMSDEDFGAQLEQARRKA